jgi:hypothetical protein
MIRGSKEQITRRLTILSRKFLLMFMRKVGGWVCALLLGAGCATQKSAAPGQPSANGTKPSAPIVTPDLRPAGRVAMVNVEGRFVVLSFPPGPVPQAGQRLSVNHAGLKIGVVQVTGPQRDYDTVGDLIEGEANIGDEAKSE